MTQNPYAQQSGFETPVAARTSVAAILSLVCALVCFVPGLGLLAVILGVAALFMISSSQGRVTGKGLAISGIFIGLLVTLAWGGAFYMLNQASSMLGKQFMGKATTFFQDVEANNYASARTILNTPAGSTAPTDADFDAFLAAYKAEVGTFQSMPKGMFEMLGGLSKLQQFNFQPGPNQVPIIAEFSNGSAVVILEMPSNFQPGSAPAPGTIPISNIGVHSINGVTIWLIPRTGLPGSPPSTPGPGTPTPPPPPPGGNGG